MRKTISSIIIMICLWFVGGCGERVQDESTIVLENSLVRRVLEREDQVWRTSSFARADGSDEMAVESDEFRILLMDGTKLSLSDYQAPGNPVISRNGNYSEIEIAYVLREALEGAPRSIVVQYSLAGEPYLRKSLTLIMEEGQAVDRLEVEHFRTGLVCDRGGIGQPIFIADSWFVGLEYPGSFIEHTSGLVTLAHYPGLSRKSTGQEGKWVIQSKTAVAGIGPKEDPLELAFRDYLETIRQPAPKHMLANTWVVDEDPGGARGYGTKEFLDYYDVFHKNLAPYGIQLDSLQPDIAKFDPQSVSLPHKRMYPGGYGSLREQLESRGSTLSLWLALNGTSNNVKWMTEQGYEKANGPFDTFYCPSAPKFNAATRKAVENAIEEGNVSYFKHDFVQMMCSLEGHGHLPTYRHGFEANLDATLEFMAYERQLKPDVLNAPTSYVWLSPWWLMHANYIFMGISDYGAVSTWPQLSYREWEMTYRDDQFFRIYKQWRIPFPMTPMITHTFLPYRFHRAKGLPETLREWSDLNAMVFARGVRLIDVYSDGNKLTPTFWQTMGEFARWYEDHLEVLGETRMVGGNPRKGQAYGFVHWKGDQGILCLRNPDVAEQAIRVPFDKSVVYLGRAGQPFRGRVIYPYVEDLSDQFTSGESMLFQVPGYTVMLIELGPGQAPEVTPARPEGLIEGTGSAVPAERDWSNVYKAYPTLQLTANVSLKVPDEGMARCDLFLMARSNGALPKFPTLTINGEAAKFHTVEGAGDTPGEGRVPRDTDTINWSIHSIDLREFRGKDVKMLAISSENPVPFLLEVWVVADRPVSATTVPEGNLPPAFWQDYRRETVRLLSYILGRVPLHH